MRKYLLRYLILWLPAVVLAYLYGRGGLLENGIGSGGLLLGGTLSAVLQWVFVAVLLIGWGINTGTAAYRYPRTTLSLLFFYVGLTVLTISTLYSMQQGTAFYTFMHTYGGTFSYKPLQILLNFFRGLGGNIDFNKEIIAMVMLIGSCGIGYLVGVVYSRVHPDPYRPRIMRK